MTVEAFAVTPQYTVAGTGPYRILTSYSDPDDLVVTATRNGVVSTLTRGIHFSVAPAGAAAAGDLILSNATATLHDGGTLTITRATRIEQGWVGQTPRERGIEASLDRIARAVQDREQDDPTLPDALATQAADRVFTRLETEQFDTIQLQNPFFAPVALLQPFLNLGRHLVDWAGVTENVADAATNALALQAMLNLAVAGKYVQGPRDMTVPINASLRLPAAGRGGWLASPGFTLQPNHSDTVGGFIGNADITTDIPFVLIENLGVAPAIDPTTGKPYAGNHFRIATRNSEFSGIRCEGYWGDQGILSAGNDIVWHDPQVIVYDSSAASGGDGGMRLLRGRNQRVFGGRIISGDDAAQFVPVSNPASWGHGDVLNCWYIGTYCESYHARALIAFLDTTTTCSIIGSGFHAISGKSGGYTAGTGGYAASVVCRGSGAVQGIEVTGFDISLGSQTGLANTEGFDIYGAVRGAVIRGTVRAPTASVATIRPDPANTALIPEDIDLQIRCASKARLDQSQPAIWVKGGKRVQLRADVVAPDAAHGILISGGEDIDVGPSSVLSVAAGFAGVQISDAVRSGVSGRVRVTGAGNSVAFGGTALTDGYLDGPVASVLPVGALPTRVLPARRIVASVSHDFGSVAAGALASTTKTVTGARVGDHVSLSPQASATGIVWNAFVSAADTVTLTAQNVTAGAIDPAAMTFRLIVSGEFA